MGSRMIQIMNVIDYLLDNQKKRFFDLLVKNDDLWRMQYIYIYIYIKKTKKKL